VNLTYLQLLSVHKSTAHAALRRDLTVLQAAVTIVQVCFSSSKSVCLPTRVMKGAPSNLSAKGERFKLSEYFALD
jgi:hypothetical protein